MKDNRNSLEVLQEQLAFQEYTIEKLNNALADQQQQISHLREELRLAMQIMQQWRVEGGNRAGEGDEKNEIPPHY